MVVTSNSSQARQNILQETCKEQEKFGDTRNIYDRTGCSEIDEMERNNPEVVSGAKTTCKVKGLNRSGNEVSPFCLIFRRITSPAVENSPGKCFVFLESV